MDVIRGGSGLGVQTPLVGAVPSEPQRIAAEVLELGQALFDAVIEAASALPEADGSEDEGFPAEEMRAAASEFFRALRVLLGMEGADGA